MKIKGETDEDYYNEFDIIVFKCESGCAKCMKFDPTNRIGICTECISGMTLKDTKCIEELEDKAN